ncbi:hypothetical protein [Brevundimonas sp.]|uniref:hypothetical protein n=1 Tax=Brevundimonas sp. TaxID=1871086 RepID=UPI001DF24698|nr:hypothetical protein [Brevundimonas sp.]MBA4001693.1 hypothetical protein [Brevundimonas sp.]
MGRGPQPEGDWRFRRLYTYAATVAGLAMLAVLVWRLEAPRELMWVAVALIVRDAWRETLYIVAPSAQAIVAGLAAWRGRP